MEQKQNTWKKIKKPMVSLLLALVLFVLAKKTYDYAAPPNGPKNCDFIYPENPDQTKPTTISVNSDGSQLNLEQKGGVINDASCLNKTSVYGIVKVTSEQ